MRRELLKLFALALLFMTACELLTPTKVANGQLYTSGDGRYDPYFETVHQEQVAAANWPDESKAARKPIITALGLGSHPSNSTITSALRDKKGDPNVGHAVDETSAAELDLARRLNVAAARLDELQKKGEDLKKQTIEDRKNLGVEKVDEKKVDKKDEVKREMAAAVDAVGSMADDARKGAKEAEELAAKLQAIWSDGKDEKPRVDEKKEPVAAKEPAAKDPPAPKDEKKEDAKKKPQPVAKKPASEPVAKKPPKPEAHGGEDEKKEAPPPLPKPPPAQKASDEVFNP
jgi:hypothetical protein